MAVASYGSVSISVADDRRDAPDRWGDDEIRTLAIRVCGFLQNHPEYLSSGQPAQIATILGSSAYAMEHCTEALGCSRAPATIAAEDRIWKSYTITLEGCRTLEQLIQASPVLHVVADAECTDERGLIIARSIEMKLGISRTVAATDGEDVAILRAHMRGPEAKFLAIATHSWNLLQSKTLSLQYAQERAIADQQRRVERDAAEARRRVEEAERLRIYNSPENVAERAAAARRQAEWDRERYEAQRKREEQERTSQIVAGSVCAGVSTTLGVIGAALWATGAHHDPSKDNTAEATMITGIALAALAIVGFCSLGFYVKEKCCK